MIIILIILTFLVWLPVFLAQIHDLQTSNQYMVLYGLKPISKYKHIYNVFMASLWFLWIWFPPLRERVYYDY